MKESIHYLVMANYLQFQKSLISNINNPELTSGQPKILEYLLFHDGAVQKEIAEACYIEPATLTSVLLGMENKELVIRKNKEGNRRNLYVYLTDKGKNLANQIVEQFEQIEKRALSGLSGQDIESLNRMLAEICKNMKQRSDSSEQK